MKNVFVSVSLVCCGLTTLSNAQTLSVHDAQKKLDSMQSLPPSSYRIIEERDLKLKNGDVITTAVSFYDTIRGNSLVDYNFFLRKYGLKTKQGKELIPVFDNIIFWENDQYLVKMLLNYYDYILQINRNFKVLKVYEPDVADGVKFVSIMKAGSWGVINERLNEIIPCEYEALSQVSYMEEYEIVVQEQRFHTYAAKSNGTWGLISSANGEIIPFEYQYLSNAFYGRVIAKKNSKWGIIGLDQNPMVEFLYDSISDDHNNYYILKGKKWGIWNSDVKIEDVKFIYDGFAINPGRGNNAVRIANKWYLMDSQPIIASTKYYDDVYVHKNAGPFIGLRIGKNWGIYNCDQKRFVTEMVYSKIVDVLYERGQDYSNGQLVVDYPVRHFKVIKADGKAEDLILKE